MDNFDFDDMMRWADEAPKTRPASNPAAATPDAEFDAMMARAGDPTALDKAGRRPDGTSYGEPPAPEAGLGDASGLDAIAGGLLKSAFETKDFLAGQTAPEDRSAFRASVEETVQLRSEQSALDGFSASVSQFAGAMLGLGKFSSAAKALPWFGKGLEAVASYAPKTAEALKAAAAGAFAFDPHEARLSNLIQTTPLANSVNAWLAADPNDTAAEGRLKAALESIGLDAAILGAFVSGTKIWRALRHGDAEEAGRLVTEAEAAEAAKEAPPAAGESQSAVDAASGPAAPEAVETPNARVEPPVSQGEAVADKPDVGSDAAAPLPGIKLADEDTEAVLKGMTDDAAAIEKHGGWYQAIEAGHTFGRGEKVPYAKLNTERDVDDFLARVVDVAEEQLDRQKGGAVLSDAKVQHMVRQRAQLFDEDPALLLGKLWQSGAGAARMVADMEAGYLVASRMFQDSYALAARIKLGDFSEFGSREGALAALKHRMSVATSVYGAARSITAASGRSLRRMRTDLRLDPETIKSMKALDGDRLADLLLETDGLPRNIAKVANPSLWAQAVDYSQFLLINNLVSGPKTQIINGLTNAYMVGARPLERMLGAAVPAAMGNAQSRLVLEEAVKQYAYLGAAFPEGFRVAVKAFVRNDSLLTPHGSEAWRGVQGGGRDAFRAVRWKAWDNPGNILHNALTVASVPLGLPTRALGTVDELVKQTVYRSKVMAAAHVEGTKAGIAAGLKGKDLSRHVATFVRDRLDSAFDVEGRGTDAKAVREAQVATFQQELLPKTIGRTVQTAVQTHPLLRLVLPFVRTPTNIIRYGWKLTPGLNVLQREYKEMLLGRMGAEAQAQATGQMMMGGLFMGTAAFMVANGRVTGGGPKDYNTAQTLRATGWQPYSVVVENEDGTRTYVPYGRLDPVAIPFGIVSDVMDALDVLEGEETPEIGAAIGALMIAVSKQFTSKTYLVGLGNLMEAMQDPDTRMAGAAGQTMANFIPYSAMLRQTNPDPVLREAREIADKMLATVPGLSETLPAKYDIWGDPMLARRGLWSGEEDSIVDEEVQRLIIESGSAPGRPNPVHNGVDLRDLTMSDGRNAYEVYQQLAGHPLGSREPLKAKVARRMATARYGLAPDGEVGVRGTKLWLLQPLFERYRTAAMRRLKRDPSVRAAFRAEEERVRAEYRANKAAAGGQPASPMKKLGASFGADLGNL